MDKKIYQYSLDGELITRWDNVLYIEKELGCSIESILNCCNGVSKQEYGFIWKFTNG